MTPPEPTPTAPAIPTCHLCGDRAAVHWQRRLTDDELAAVQQLEQDRRDQVMALADPAQAPPTFPPLPGPQDFTTVVHGCVAHAITIEAAALIHAKTCTAPGAVLPGCDCTPEPAPAPEPDPEPLLLPPGW